MSQFVAFAAVGTLGTGVHFLVLVILVSGAGVSPLGASSLGALFGAIVNYLLNYYFTFGSRARHSAAWPKFLAVATAGLAINGAIVEIGTHFTALHYLMVQVVATGAVLLFGFTANRMWTFKGDMHAIK